MSRREEQSRLYRRVLALSFGVAMVVHAIVLLWNPAYTVEVPETRTVRLALEMRFGVPEVGGDQEWNAERDSAPELVLVQVPRPIDLVRHWPSAYRAYNVGGSGTLSLMIDSLGRVVSSTIAESSGDDLKDQAFLEMATSFSYGFPAGRATTDEMLLLQRITVDEMPHAIEIGRSSR